MCGPMMGIMGAGIGMLGQVAAASEKQKEIDAYNKQASINARDAGIAASNKYTDMQTKFIYDSRANQQEGYQTAIKGMEAKGVATATAGSSGFQVGSFSVNDIVSNMDKQTFEALDNNKMKAQDLKDSFKSDTRSAEAEAQGRINSMPYKASPSGAGLAIGLLSSAVGGLKGAVS